jgi:uncharacterized protein
MKITPGAVAFDIDGVVANTMRLFIEIARDKYQIDGLRYSDITDYDLTACLDLEESEVYGIAQHIFDGSYDTPLLPIDGAPDVLKRLSRFDAPVLFITARPYPGPMAKWIKTAVGLETADCEIIATGSFEKKAEILLDRSIEWFVEDRLETCFLLDQAGIKPIVFRQPWNRKPHSFVEVESWAGLADLIDFK